MNPNQELIDTAKQARELSQQIIAVELEITGAKANFERERFELIKKRRALAEQNNLLQQKKRELYQQEEEQRGQIADLARLVLTRLVSHGADLGSDGAKLLDLLAHRESIRAAREALKDFGSETQP